MFKFDLPTGEGERQYREALARRECQEYMKTDDYKSKMEKLKAVGLGASATMIALAAAGFIASGPVSATHGMPKQAVPIRDYGPSAVPIRD